MKKSICHYSLNRLWNAEKWDCVTLCRKVKEIGSTAVDFHANLLGTTDGAAQNITDALKQTGLELSGLSLGNNFNQDDPAKFKEQVTYVKNWLAVAAQVKAPVSRIFGGHIPDRSNAAALKRGFDLIMDGLGQVVREAERLGVVLALENHGGLPCTGEEQVDVIRKINSKNLRATVDVGNYMQGNQEGHVGTAIAASYAAYVHFKDFKKQPQAERKLQACIVGKGDVDLARCLETLKKAGFNGYVALEYEGPEDPWTGAKESWDFMSKVMQGY
jgi:sugar phosphate isomerase/epimerase